MKKKKKQVELMLRKQVWVLLHQIPVLFLFGLMQNGVEGNSYLADCLPMARPTLIRLSAITPRPTQRCIPRSPL